MTAGYRRSDLGRIRHVRVVCETSSCGITLPLIPLTKAQAIVAARRHVAVFGHPATLIIEHFQVVFVPKAAL